MLVEELMKTQRKVNPQKVGRRILLIDGPDGQWADYLRSFFEESSAALIELESVMMASVTFDRIRPDICFLNPDFLTPALTQKVKVRCEIDKSFHLFLIGEDNDPRTGLPYACSFDAEEQGYEFLKKFSDHLKLPAHVRVLIADDDPEIRNLMKRHLAKSSYPAFEVILAEDGAAAIRQIKQKQPDIVILDIQMPKKTGHEVYAYIQSREEKIPVIVYLDIFSSQQIMDLYKLGRPLVIDKGGEGSSMNHVASFIKKVLYLQGCDSELLKNISQISRERKIQ